ncbi:MAG: helix-turn-helix transcriptional regulator [bacterium]|nr:helix-turn-helix transcriptional regulator [bacterium]MDE0601063.1 helix-turn-helix transcriptional regulator [bacterium]
MMRPVRLIRTVAGMTQRDLADAAETSQPTVAAYESGTKSPTWRTVERIASSVGLACYPAIGAALTRDQERSLFLHAAIAKELRVRRTEIIEIARLNISRMRSVNPHAWRLLDDWERILHGTTSQIVACMLDPGEHGRDLRQVSPFAGVLTPAQRVAVYRSFRSAV